MNHVLFAKMDQVFSKENKTLNNTGILEKILEKSGKSQGILSFRKSGNPDCGSLCVLTLIITLWNLTNLFSQTYKYQVRIQDLVKGEPQLLRPKVADITKRSHASILWPGSRARLRALEAFGFLMLKYAFSHILETLFLLFLTSILTPKVDKNRALDFTSINLRHSDMLHLFFNLHEKSYALIE